MPGDDSRGTAMTAALRKEGLFMQALSAIPQGIQHYTTVKERVLNRTRSFYIYRIAAGARRFPLRPFPTGKKTGRTFPQFP